jgi:putative transposase
MNTKVKSAVPVRSTPWQRLGEHDGFVIGGIDYRTQRSDRHGQLLHETSHPTATAFFGHQQWEKIREEPGFQHHPDMHNPHRVDIRKLAGVQYASDIPPDQLMRMHFYEQLVIELMILHQNGEIKLDKHEVQKQIDGEMGRRARDKLKQRQLGTKALGGRAFTTFEVTGSALLKKRRDYLRRGFEGLRDGRFRSGNKQTRLQPEVTALIALHLAASISNPSATANSIHDDIRDDIEERNQNTVLEAAASKNEDAFAVAEMLHVPDIKTIRRAKAALDPFQVAIGKHGLDVAVQLNPAVRGRPEYLGPLDRVEYDESIVDAITILTESGVWAYLTAEEKKRIKRCRLVIGIAICVATRCIVGMRIYPVGNGDETVATFKMIVEDKTKYIPIDLRDKLSWHQHGGPGSFVIDQGSSNISDEARTVLANLNVPLTLAQAGRPDQRGTGERIFRTFGSEIYSYLDARTGSNIIDRRKYQPEERASLTVDELWKVLVIGVVGIYHNTPHRELGGNTPADEWERLISNYGVNALPDRNRYRVTFGKHRKKTVTRYGVAFAGLSYTNPLVNHHYLHGQGLLEVAGDPDDLGAVSVKLGDSWYEAPCTDPDMRGVSLPDWYTACTQEKDLNCANPEKRREARRAAKKAVRVIQENARNRENTHPPIVTEEMIAQGERRIFGKYQHAEEDMPVANGQLGMVVEPDNDDVASSPDFASMPLENSPSPASQTETHVTAKKRKPKSTWKMTK